jgi:hypothetical protein
VEDGFIFGTENLVSMEKYIRDFSVSEKKNVILFFFGN